MGTLGYINEFSSKALLRMKHQFSHNFEFKNCFCEVSNHLNITNFEIVVGFEECLLVEISIVLSFPSTPGVSWEDWEGGSLVCVGGGHTRLLGAPLTVGVGALRLRLCVCVCGWEGHCTLVQVSGGKHARLGGGGFLVCGGKRPRLWGYPRLFPVIVDILFGDTN